jgi:hypothetical protein
VQPELIPGIYESLAPIEGLGQKIQTIGVVKSAQFEVDLTAPFIFNFELDLKECM